MREGELTQSLGWEREREEWKGEAIRGSAGSKGGRPTIIGGVGSRARMAGGTPWCRLLGMAQHRLLYGTREGKLGPPPTNSCALSSPNRALPLPLLWPPPVNFHLLYYSCIYNTAMAVAPTGGSVYRYNGVDGSFSVHCERKILLPISLTYSSSSWATSV